MHGRTAEAATPRVSDTPVIPLTPDMGAATPPSKAGTPDTPSSTTAARPQQEALNRALHDKLEQLRSACEQIHSHFTDYGDAAQWPQVGFRARIQDVALLINRALFRLVTTV